LFPGYLRPPSSSPLDPALSVLCDVLSSGRTSRLFKRLVVPGKLLSVDAAESFPGDQMTTLLLLYGIPTPGTPSQLPRIFFVLLLFCANDFLSGFCLYESSGLP
jgi:predicted Zn-dependent peptidase